jgi:hypothetical protein
MERTVWLDRLVDGKVVLEVPTAKVRRIHALLSLQAYKQAISVPICEMRSEYLLAFL